MISYLAVPVPCARTVMHFLRQRKHAEISTTIGRAGFEDKLRVDGVEDDLHRAWSAKPVELRLHTRQGGNHT